MDTQIIGLNDNLIEIDLNVSKCIMESLLAKVQCITIIDLLEPNKMLLKHKKQSLIRSSGSQIKETNITKMTS